MKLMTDMQNGRTVVSVREERLDAHNSNELKDRIHKILEDDAHNLIVDLGQVSFIGQLGLGALLSGYKNANLRSSAFALAGLQPRVKSMLELTRLHRVFDIYPGLPDALGS